MEITVQDIDNLLLLLKRVNFTGLDEAKVGVILEAKLTAHKDRLVEEANGDDVPPTD